MNSSTVNRPERVSPLFKQDVDRVVITKYGEIGKELSFAMKTREYTKYTRELEEKIRNFGKKSGGSKLL